MSNTASADHALLSDRHSCALVDRIAPTGEWRCTRRYVDRTLVLETTFTSDASHLETAREGSLRTALVGRLATASVWLE